MNTTVVERQDNVVRLEVEVSREEVGRALEATLRELAKEVKLPGFRQGKVPPRLVAERYGMPVVARQMVEEYMPQWYATAVLQAGLDPVSEPELDFDKEPKEGEPFQFHASVEVMPLPVLGQYIGVEVPREPEIVVADEEVNAQVERLREQFAELRPVLGRPVRKGDVITVDISGSVDGVPADFATARDYTVEAGAGRMMDTLDEAVIGMSTGEERSAIVVLPEDFQDPELAGKNVDFVVKVKDVKQKILPALNDDFAKDVSDFATLLELRLDIRRKMQSSRDAAARQRFKLAAVQKAAEVTTVDLPEQAIDRQAHELLEDFAHSFESRGLNFANYVQQSGRSVESMLADFRPKAIDVLRTGLTLEAVADAEGLEPTDEEVTERVREMARAARVDGEGLLAHLRESGRIRGVQQQLMREKAADLIGSKAVVVEPPVQIEEVPAEQAVPADADVPVPEAGEGAEGA